MDSAHGTSSSQGHGAGCNDGMPIDRPSSVGEVTKRAPGGNGYQPSESVGLPIPRRYPTGPGVVRPPTVGERTLGITLVYPEGSRSIEV